MASPPSFKGKFPGQIVGDWIWMGDEWEDIALSQTKYAKTKHTKAFRKTVDDAKTLSSGTVSGRTSDDPASPRRTTLTLGRENRPARQMRSRRNLPRAGCWPQAKSAPRLSGSLAVYRRE